MDEEPLGRTLSIAVADLVSRGEELTPSSLLEQLGIGRAFHLDGPASADPEDGSAPLGEFRATNRFRMIGELGRGGMGVVMEGQDPELARSVAVKVVLDPARVTAAQLARFVVEARVTGQLQHPNIVPVYAMGVTDGGQVFFAMKKVEGRTMAQVLTALADGDPATLQEWTRPRLLQAFMQVCNAVAYAHSRHVLHRDLKPGNVMFGPFGEVLVMDWGLVRRVDDDEAPPWAGGDAFAETVEALAPTETSSLAGPDFVMPTMARTADGAMIGTPGYMSPEQSCGDLEQLDARSDLWSLGAILYELLTLQRAYVADSIYALIFRSMHGPPDDPRERAPERRVDGEIAEICLKALAREPDDRFDSVSQLSEAVQAFVEGSRRRAAAAGHVKASVRAWRGYLRAREEHERLLEVEEDLRGRIKPWLPVEEKEDLIQAQDRLEELVEERVDRFEAAVAECEQALSQDPENLDASAQLAAMHYARFEEAERDGDPTKKRHHRRRVMRYDDGRYAAQLQGTGAVTLETDPSGAEVLAQPVLRQGLIWPLGEPVLLGRTPLVDLPLEMGSWIFTIRSPGRRDTTCPILIERGARWTSGDRPIPLLRDADIGPDFVYVPRGPFVAGGDAEAWGSEPREVRQVDGFLMSRHPVTMAEWAEYLTWLSGRDPEAAWSAVPRIRTTDVGAGMGQMWPRPAPGQPYSVPEVDGDGDEWDPRWPVCGITWRDVQGFLRWWGARTGLPCVLPSENEWEKAARGVDGRFLPWGDRFDSSLCAMLTSRPGPARPEPVGGRPHDRSVYGVQDLAGCIRTMCRDLGFDGKPDLRPIRGGAFRYDERNCRLAWRNGLERGRLAQSVGFRLARPLP